jgi:hypothetical protein
VLFYAKRLGDAERFLERKETKSAREDERIAKNKIRTLLERLNDLRRAQQVEDDGRIFPLRMRL